ncbi:citrate synthase [Sphingomonas asaccharolytica]|uniref:citrate synthase n=1 Tax=Sphingomonas asaccharolytica TaxID=40681 RepID=UPI00082A7DFC|nr:citrate synthase [Sphingomonas asaccharolytica]
MQEWLSRDEALVTLGVRPQTLYAYVSRGLIERRADAVDPRRSEYRGDDILALTKRRARGRRTASIAASAMAWGEPVIPTRISTVAHGQLVFRGRRATELADHATLEEIAAMLWEQPVAVFPAAAGDGDPFRALAALIAGAKPMIGRAPAKLAQEASVAVAAIAGTFGAAGDGAIHERLARGWSLDATGTDLVRRALVLLADHELNPSTFAARIAASTGAPMAACLMAGLSTLSGPKHGGAGAALSALAAEAKANGVDMAVARWLAAGHGLPGFGHPLYPHGDPRAAALLPLVTLDPMLTELRNAVVDATEALPNIDFALLAMTVAADLPADAPFRLFATARGVGWAAHAIEQSASGAVIRPRARYQGLTTDALGNGH